MNREELIRHVSSEMPQYGYQVNVAESIADMIIELVRGAKRETAVSILAEHNEKGMSSFMVSTALKIIKDNPKKPPMPDVIHNHR